MTEHDKWDRISLWTLRIVIGLAVVVMWLVVSGRIDAWLGYYTVRRVTHSDLGRHHMVGFGKKKFFRPGRSAYYFEPMVAELVGQ